MQTVASIEVIVPGTQAERLLLCLRQKAVDYNVRIEPGSEGQLLVDEPGNVGDLHGFLRETLEGCGSDLDLVWGDFLEIAEH